MEIQIYAFSPLSCKMSLKGQRNIVKRGKWAGKRGSGCFPLAKDTNAFCRVHGDRLAWTEQGSGWWRIKNSWLHFSDIFWLSAGLEWGVNHVTSRNLLEQKAYLGTFSSFIPSCMVRVREGTYSSPASKAGCTWPQEVTGSGLESSLGVNTFIPNGCWRHQDELNKFLFSMNHNLVWDVE